MTPDQLFDSFVDCALRRDPEAFADLFTDDATMAFPFADLVYAGQDAIRARVRDAWRMSATIPAFRVREYADTTRLTTRDAIVAEYTVRGSVGGQELAVRAVLRLDVRDGRIAAMREYLDPAGVAAARPPRELLRRFYAAMQAKSADAFADLYAEGGIHEFGFTVPNRPKQLVGRETIRASYAEGWRNHPLEILAIDDEFVFQAIDPEVVIGQWRGRATHQGNPVSLTGLIILRVRAGAIVHCYDFMDALGIARALGRPPFGN